jgi:hypothetical protein
MSPASQHQLVVFGACVGVLVCIFLLVTFVRSRSKKYVQTEQDDLAQRIEERLASGRFSREPSAIRRKVSTPSPLPTSTLDTSSPDDLSAADDLDISRHG